MRIKSYFANSVTEALEKARRELGPDAMLLNSKNTEAELRGLGEYEVVFALAPEPAMSVARSKIAAPAIGTQPLDNQTFDNQTFDGKSLDGKSGGNELARELAELRKQIESVKRSVTGRSTAGSGAGSVAGVAAEDIRAELESADFSAETASELAQLFAAQSATGPVESIWRAEWERRLRIQATVGRTPTKPGAVLFAGPAGAGKTTTLFKLAIRYGMQARLPVHLLTLDTLRVAGSEQLASYARIAGLGFDVAHTPAAFDRVLGQHAAHKLVLIDTPGLAPGDGALLGWLAARRGNFETQVVISAVTQPKVNLRALDRLAPLEPAKLLFTHFDEAETRGPLLETVWRSGLPVSFLGTGQQVPDDLCAAAWERLFMPLSPRVFEAEGFIASAA